MFTTRRAILYSSSVNILDKNRPSSFRVWSLLVTWKIFCMRVSRSFRNHVKHEFMIFVRIWSNRLLSPFHALECLHLYLLTPSQWSVDSRSSSSDIRVFFWFRVILCVYLVLSVVVTGRRCFYHYKLMIMWPRVISNSLVNQTILFTFSVHFRIEARAWWSG